MQPVFVGLSFVIFCWGASAIPCGIWSLDRPHDISVTHPVQEEIILLTFVEEGGSAAADAGVNPVQSDSIPTDDSDDKQSAEIVDSIANKNFSVIAKSDPLPSGKTREAPPPTIHTTETSDVEEVRFTTEIGKKSD